jgi:GNAT superfamily N-acetyltransferase
MEINGKAVKSAAEVEGGPKGTQQELIIRRGLPADAVALAEFGRRLYAATFGAENDPDDMEAYLSANYGIAQQTEELSSPQKITLLAELDERLIGYAQVRSHPAPDCVSGLDPLELHRFYVDFPYHGHGVAQLLMEEAFAAAHELGGRTLWLSVWERNLRAIRFYEKWGLMDVGSTDFWVGSDRQTDRVMAAKVPTRPEPD